MESRFSHAGWPRPTAPQGRYLSERCTPFVCWFVKGDKHMITKIIGAALGAKAAKQSRAMGGASGAALGAAVPFILRRMSIPAMLAVGAGGYFAKRAYDKKEAEGTAKDLSGAKVKNPGEAPSTRTGSVIVNPPGGATNGTGKSTGATV
jgi:hypothetical protein